jgi:hypothetical protein
MKNFGYCMLLIVYLLILIMQLSGYIEIPFGHFKQLSGPYEIPLPSCYDKQALHVVIVESSSSFITVVTVVASTTLLLRNSIPPEVTAHVDVVQTAGGDL